MVDLSLVEKDLKRLRDSLSPAARRARLVATLLSMSLFLGLIALHLWLASPWAHEARLTFAQAWAAWVQGIHAHQWYSGLYLKSMEQFDRSAILAAFVVFLVAQWLINTVEQRRRARLLAWIDSKRIGMP